MPWAVAAAAVGGLIQSDSSRRAANTQADASREANALQADQYGQTVARNEPFVSGGTNAFRTLLARLNSGEFGRVPTAQDVMSEPGYEFGRDQGMRGLNRQLNARGLSYSGAQLKAASKFNNDYASGQYGNAFNRLQGANQQNYNHLMGAAGMGQASANNTASAGQQFANQAGNNLTGAANAQAANSLAQGNIWGNVINQGVSAYNNRPAQSSNAWNSGTGGSGSSGVWGGSVSDPWYG